jgi:hypothetical protein
MLSNELQALTVRFVSIIFTTTEYTQFLKSRLLLYLVFFLQTRDTVTETNQIKTRIAAFYGQQHALTMPSSLTP